MNMGTLPLLKLASSIFQSSRSTLDPSLSYILSTLKSQRSDAVDSEEDCRRKNIAQHLFYQTCQRPTAHILLES